MRSVVGDHHDKRGGRCSECQTELASGAKFCPTCGRAVGT
ncbi:zinc-ribbon domain-containing protein [Azonexus fungiphilus]